MRLYKVKTLLYFLTFIILITVVIFAAQSLNDYVQETDTEKNPVHEVFCKNNELLVCGDLPVINILVDETLLEKEEYSIANLYEYYPIDNEKYPYEFTSFKNAVAIKYRGDSSYALFDKPQFKIEFRKDTDLEDRVNRSMLGMNESDDWAFHGPFIDTSLMHNKLLYSLSKDIFDWAPDSRYFELYLNSEYLGIYLAVEYPSTDESRLDLSDFGLLGGETPYLVQRNRLGFGDLMVPSYGETYGHTSYPITIKYPNKDDITKEQFDYIEKDFSEIEKRLYSDTFTTDKESYRDLIDMESFIDYFIINELAMIKDAAYQSMFMYKDFNEKLKVTVWDFNNAFDHYVYSEVDYDEWVVASNNWYNQFLSDREFVKPMIDRYYELRESTLSNENIMSLIDEYQRLLRSSESRNYDKWGYIHKESLISVREENAPINFEQSVQKLKENIEKRLEFMDRHIVDFYVW